MADRPLFVVVLPLTADTQVHAEDASAVGVYEVMADTSTGDVLSAASALESFHIRTPISFPENFAWRSYIGNALPKNQLCGSWLAFRPG